MVKYFFLSVGILLFIASCDNQKRIAKTSYSNKSNKVNVKSDSLGTTVKPRSYADVITVNTFTDAGLFKVHKNGEKYFFEIPDSLMNTDILVVNRIVRSATGVRVEDGTFGYGGDQISQKVIQFSKASGNKVFMRQSFYGERTSDTSENSLRWSVYKSNLQPIIAAFDIQAYAPDSLAVVIDVTDFFNKENAILFFPPHIKTLLGVNSFQPDKSYIEQIKSFPCNVETRTVKTYQSSNSLYWLTYEINNSFVQLPKTPMRPRYEDPRVGFFGLSYTDFDANPAGTDQVSLITRWRVEPKEGEMEKYLRGELVEPQTPIVYYIDPATPRKWVPYLIQGVNDWQKAFESAGFKNAIYALEAPVNDAEWSVEDARHNVIVYKASELHNASGPNINDPRTGEILETHINWYHNIMKLLKDWYKVQAGAIDPRARQAQLPDSLMGQLIRFAIAHEVGHTLGLAHNMASSFTVPVEKLRDKKWLAQNGHTPSIMDYARFNYVAQPEDSITAEGILPRIGDYDKWAIEWGYRILPDVKTREEERVYMTKWVTARIKQNKRLWYGFDFLRDPRMQTEDLGDDPVKAGRYGIMNLKRIVPHVAEWTKEPAKGYNEARLFYGQVVNQYTRYLYHAANNIGILKTTDKTVEEAGPVYEFNEKARQRAAVLFLQDELFDTPTWLMDSRFFSLFNEGNSFQIMRLQKSILQKVLSVATLASLLKFQTTFPAKAYTPSEFLGDLKAGIWKELYASKPVIDIFRRNAQKQYILQLIDLLKVPDGKDPLTDAAYSLLLSTDLYSILKWHCKQLEKEISKALNKCDDQMTRLHLEETKNRLQHMSYKEGSSKNGMSSDAALNGINYFDSSAMPEKRYKDGWENCYLFSLNADDGR